MDRCKKCLLPESYPNILFDAQGVCNYCNESNPSQNSLGKEKLSEFFKDNMKKTSIYDCLVPLSGGKDSSYVLLYVVRELGLKPMVLSYDSGFQTMIAQENIKNACEILDVPSLVIKSPGKLQARLMRESYLLAKKYGTRWWGSCDNCEAILRTVTINAARKYKIPFVMWGSSAIEAADKKKYEESQSGKGLQHKTNSLTFLINRILKKGLKEPSKLLSHLKFYVLNMLQRISLGFPLKYIINPLSTPPLSVENPMFIPFFDYVQWDSINNSNLIENEIGWKHPVGLESRFDCELHCVNNYNTLHESGITSDGVSYCNFIREGKITRDEGLEKEKLLASLVEPEYRELLIKLDLPDEKPL